MSLTAHACSLGLLYCAAPTLFKLIVLHFNFEEKSSFRWGGHCSRIARGPTLHTMALQPDWRYVVVRAAMLPPGSSQGAVGALLAERPQYLTASLQRLEKMRKKIKGELQLHL